LTRKKKVVSDTDGTPIETEEDLPVDETAETEPKADVRKVRITQKGEDVGAFTEHGQHKAGEEVDTSFADIFVERGWAEEIS
jgi:hypothetical protein